MKHFLFEDCKSGEEFIIGADSPEELAAALSQYDFNDVRFICMLTDIEAEMSGLDEY